MNFVIFLLPAKAPASSISVHALHVVGSGVANNLNDASYLPHLTQSFLVLDSTSCNLTEGSLRRNSTFVASIRRVPSLPAGSAICRGWRIMEKTTSRQSRSINHHQTSYFGTIHTRLPFLLKSRGFTPHFLFLSLVMWDLSVRLEHNSTVLHASSDRRVQTT